MAETVAVAGAAESPLALYEKKEKQLETACRQFEGILLSMLWKEMMSQAREMGGEGKRPYGVMEDTAVEMASESLSSSGEGAGLWRVLYEQLHASLGPEPAEDGASGAGSPGGVPVPDASVPRRSVPVGEAPGR